MARSFRSAFYLLRFTLCLSAQVSHLAWFGIAGARQSRQRPCCFALRRCSWAWRRRYSRRSGVSCLRCSYFWRSARLAASSVGDVCFRFAGSFSACCFPFGFWGGFCLASQSVLDLMVPGRSKTTSQVRLSTRPRGGTMSPLCIVIPSEGLSPRGRGNPS